MPDLERFQKPLTEKFLRKAKKIHGNKFDYTDIVYTGLENEILFSCPIHGKVTCLAKQHLKGCGCPECQRAAETIRHRSGRYNRTRGHNYERQIVSELREIGYKGCVTARAESRTADNNKVDIIDPEKKLPVYVQTKKSQKTPDFFAIKDQCPYTDKPFVIFWSKEKKDQTTYKFKTTGEIVMLPKEYFYELIKIGEK